jgi:hypothetical protein
MSDPHQQNLADHLAALKEQEAALKQAIKQARDERRRQQLQRQAELGLASVPRPRRDNKFTSTIDGETARITAFLRLETLREVRDLATRCGWSISATIDQLATLGLQGLTEGAGGGVRPDTIASGVTNEVVERTEEAVPTSTSPRRARRYSY